MTPNLVICQRELVSTATVIKINSAGESNDDHRTSLVLSESPLQPERKDRPGDTGCVNGLRVARVTYGSDRRKRHHFDDNAVSKSFEPGEQVQVTVDRHVRSSNAAILTGGRLIEVIGKASSISLQPVDASYWPNRAFVDFGGVECLPEPELLLPMFRREIERSLLLELPITTNERTRSEFSQVQIGEYEPFVCSGLYPASLRAIERIDVIRIAFVGGSLQVRYRVCQRR